jgi:hypothetical protein
MDQDRINYLRGEVEGERISLGELIEIQGEFDKIDPATLPEPAENAMASDMLDEIEARLPREPRRWIVTGTSMVVEADTAQDAVERADQMSGWHWEAVEVTDVRIDLSDSQGVVCGGCGITIHDVPHEDGRVTCVICGHSTEVVVQVRGCSCGMADYGAPGHDGDPNAEPHEEDPHDDDGNRLTPEWPMPEEDNR